MRRTRRVGDFTRWKGHDSYSKAFGRLLRGLKAGARTAAVDTPPRAAIPSRMPNTPPGTSAHADLRDWFGDIDIYLFDQLLKGRLTPRMRVLDAGCGGGRNLIYFLRGGYEVYAVDQSREAVAHVRSLASTLAPHLPPGNFRVEHVERMSFDDATFDAVISSAVLHFARDEEQWQGMVREMWRVLKPGGIFFARLASGIGIEGQIERLEGRRYRLPDGSDRFLVDAEMIMGVTESLGGEMLEPLKTVIVQNMRSMSTWCLRKS